MKLDAETFEGLVARALDELPAWVRERMDNVAIVVERWPNPGQRRETHTGPGRLLLGLYEGIPLTQRGRGYQLVAPDRITLFQGSLELYARNTEDLVRLIRDTVVHEVAHHFGMSDAQLREMEGQT